MLVTSHSDTTGIRPLTDGELDHVAGGATVAEGLGTTVNDLLGTVGGTLVGVAAVVDGITVPGLQTTVNDLLGSL